MNWDPTLLRKFSSTGHFRLLNQLKGDLRKKPLDRDLNTGKLRVSGSGRPARTSSPRQINPSATAVRLDQSTAPVQPEFIKETPKTFRERLNAIEMR